MCIILRKVDFTECSDYVYLQLKLIKYSAYSSLKQYPLLKHTYEIRKYLLEVGPKEDLSLP